MADTSAPTDGWMNILNSAQIARILRAIFMVEVC